MGRNNRRSIRHDSRFATGKGIDRLFGEIAQQRMEKLKGEIEEILSSLKEERLVKDFSEKSVYRTHWYEEIPFEVTTIHGAFVTLLRP